MLCSAGDLRKPGNKADVLEGADRSRELGLWLGDWEPGGPECGDPHRPHCQESLLSFRLSAPLETGQ